MEIKEFIHIFLTMIGGLLSVVSFLVWRILHRIETTLEELRQMTHNCRESLPERFVTRNDQVQYQFEFDKLWEAVNFHEHSEDGRVIR